MSQPLIITLLLFALALPVLGAIVLRVLTPRLAPVQLHSTAALLLGVVVVSVLVLARGDIPSLQIGNLSILLPVTAPEDSILPLVPTPQVDQQQPPPAFATTAPVTATAAPAATALAIDTPMPEPTATPTVTPEPTAAPTVTPEPTAVPPTAAPPPASQRKYTVQPGDTLLSIAREFNTTVTAIVEANNLTPEQADALRIGQELVIP